jgi:hypothetical protein
MVLFIFCHGNSTLQLDSYEQEHSFVEHSVKAMGPSIDSIIDAIEIFEADLQSA